MRIAHPVQICIQGLFTSMMLIAAAPALVLGWPTSRLPTTAMVMNLGIFGAVAAGPVRVEALVRALLVERSEK